MRRMPALTTDALVDADQSGKVLHSSKCHTGTMIADLPASAQAAVILALTTKTVPTSKIVAVLQKHDLPAKSENVARHRRRMTGTGSYACKCPRLSEALS